MAKWLAGAQSIPNERGVEDASWRRQHLRRALIQKYWHDLDKRENDRGKANVDGKYEVCLGKSRSFSLVERRLDFKSNGRSN